MKYTYTLALAAAVLPLGAQSNNEDGRSVYELDPVVVTAELWESELQSTTASVTVLDAAQFQSDGTQHFEDVVDTIPNLTWTGGTSRPRYLQIRGIGENSQFEGETPDSTVRFLVDDLDFTGLGTVGSLFDVTQVEVLRGPQAGAFGANAAGGVVKIVTQEPTAYWTGQAEATAATDDQLVGGLAFGGPLLENDPEVLTFRFALQQLVADGFRDNQFLDRDDTNERDEFMSRLKLRWQPSPDWQWDGTLFFADADNGYDEFSLDNTGFDTYSDEPGRDTQESLAGSLRGHWTGPGTVELTSITGYTTTDSLYSYDADWGAGTTVTGRANSGYSGFLATDRERDVVSQELRLDSTAQEDALGWIDRWTVGAYFQRLQEDTVADYGDEFGTLNAVSDYESRNASLYSQLAHDFSANTRLILGLRAEAYKVETDSAGTDSGFYAGDLASGDAEEDGTLWGGKLTLEHDLNDAHMAFASAARGYKAGGANVPSFLVAGDPATYDDETLYNFELGLRSDWLDGALTTKLTAFYLHRIDAQLRDSTGAGGFFRYLTVNGDTADHYGLEAEADWRFAPDWMIGADLGLLETDRESYADPGGTVPSRGLSNAPSYTYSLRLDYRPEEGLFANAELTGRDSYYESNSHDERRDAYAIVNAAVGYRSGPWTTTLWVKNLFDERYSQRVFFFDNFDGGTKNYRSPANPRQIGATLNYSW